VTDEQKRAAILAEVVRGRDALRAAEALLGLALFADAVSRAYYAAYHHACALLLSVGEEPKTHGGVHRLVQRDFVRTRKLSPEVGHLLSRLQTYRQSADYTAEYVFTAETAREEIAGASTFIGASVAVLQQEGWLDPPA
jgi:uncharacterized protein (UPF0332 family)